MEEVKMAKMYYVYPLFAGLFWFLDLFSDLEMEGCCLWRNKTYWDDICPHRDIKNGKYRTRLCRRQRQTYTERATSSVKCPIWTTYVNLFCSAWYKREVETHQLSEKVDNSCTNTSPFSNHQAPQKDTMHECDKWCTMWNKLASKSRWTPDTKGK